MKHLRIEGDDLNDLLTIIEKSYNFRFEGEGFRHVTTFGELVDAITAHICLPNKDDCTSQQAFYKLRTALFVVNGNKRVAIKPDTTLDSLFPRKNRRNDVMQLEQQVGVELNVLQLKAVVAVLLIVLFISSAILLFIKPLYGCLGFISFCIGVYFAQKTANEFAVQTVRQLVEKMTREHYLQSRRNPATINNAELTENIRQVFAHCLDIEATEITRESVIV